RERPPGGWLPLAPPPRHYVDRRAADVGWHGVERNPVLIRRKRCLVQVAVWIGRDHAHLVLRMRRLRDRQQTQAQKPRRAVLAGRNNPGVIGRPAVGREHFEAWCGE